MNEFDLFSAWRSLKKKNNKEKRDALPSQHKREHAAQRFSTLTTPGDITTAETVDFAESMVCVTAKVNTPCP